MSEAVTWHHGLVARWWAEFNVGGDDIAWFRREIERSGAPALDAGCGCGRLLVPYRVAGLDVDGIDASPDMLAWCKRRAEQEGVTVTVQAQALHALDLPRRYRTIINCGAFGLGGSREMDLEGLRRAHAHLLPGGALVMDLHLPNFDERNWRAWLPAHRPRPSTLWREGGDRRQAADGSFLELRSRQVDFDPLAQRYTAELRVDHYAENRLVAREEHRLVANIYFRCELELMLRAAGFVDVEVTAAGEARAPEPWRDQRLMVVARRG